MLSGHFHSVNNSYLSPTFVGCLPDVVVQGLDSRFDASRSRLFSFKPSRLLDSSGVGP